MDINIPDPKFLAHLSGEMNQTLGGMMKELGSENKISRKISNDGASGGGTKFIKTVGSGVVDGMVGIFIPLHNRTDTPDIDDDHQ